VLIVAPTLLLAAVIHFWVQANKRKQKIEFAKVFGDDVNVVDAIQSEVKQDDKNDDGCLHEADVASVERIEVKPRTEVDQGLKAVKYPNRRQSLVHGIHIATKVAQELEASSNIILSSNNSSDVDFMLFDESNLQYQISGSSQSKESFDLEHGSLSLVGLQNETNLDKIESVSMGKIDSNGESYNSDESHCSFDSLSVSTDLSNFSEILDLFDKNY
jgi:hypothetical protein